MIERRNGLAFLCHPYHRGGVTRWMADAAGEWVARGSPCWFVTPRPRERFVSGAARPALTELIESLPAGRQPTLVAPTVGSEFEFGTQGYRARAYARALAGAVPPGVPVVVSNDPATWRALEMLQGRNPLIGVLHADEAIYYALASRFHKTAAAIVSVSKRVFARASEAVGAWGTTTAVIPCGIPLVSRHVLTERRNGDLGLVWVGRISESQKRVSDLCAIGQALRDAGYPFRLDIVGDGEDAAALRACVERARLVSQIQFHGWVTSSAVLSTLSHSDLMLLPSNYEGMPVAGMEALASGCAVVGSDTCGLEEYAEDPSGRDALWIYPRGDIAAAVDAIARASRVPRARRRAAARRLAEEEFGIEVCMERYRRMLGGLTPVASSSGVGMPARHPADLASWVLSRARLLRALAERRRSQQGRSPQRVTASAA